MRDRDLRSCPNYHDLFAALTEGGLVVFLTCPSAKAAINCSSYSPVKLEAIPA